METNGQKANPYVGDCPSRQILNLIGDKWTTLVIGLLDGHTMRFSELRRRIGGISQKMLTQTLRNLERDGLVERTVYPEVPPRVEYSLTPLGETLTGPLSALMVWAEDHLDAVAHAQQKYDSQN
ncbi:MAG: helix-turn-helix transcriptional regulator [Anaerolineae bacterium]|nr:helix-turn-helix transcriptional regulator [Anaerolineae bacterium]